MKYLIINDLKNDTSLMVQYTREFEITVAYLWCRPSTFWKRVEKKR